MAFDMFTALALSFTLSFLVGMERQLSKKPVGFAPYVLVTVLSSAVTLISSSIFEGASQTVISGIISGIGFLGAGALIRMHEKVFGFTTAAIIWSMAVFGIVVALGNLELISLTYGIIWTAIFVDKLLEREGLGRHMRDLTVIVKGTGSHTEIREILAQYKDIREEALELSFDRGLVQYKFAVPKFGNQDHTLLEKLTKVKGIKSILLE